MSAEAPSDYFSVSTRTVPPSWTTTWILKWYRSDFEGSRPGDSSGDEKRKCRTHSLLGLRGGDGASSAEDLLELLLLKKVQNGQRMAPDQAAVVLGRTHLEGSALSLDTEEIPPGSLHAVPRHEDKNVVITHVLETDRTGVTASRKAISSGTRLGEASEKPRRLGLSLQRASPSSYGVIKLDSTR